MSESERRAAAAEKAKLELLVMDDGAAAAAKARSHSADGEPAKVDMNVRDLILQQKLAERGVGKSERSKLYEKTK